MITKNAIRIEIEKQNSSFYLMWIYSTENTIRRNQTALPLINKLIVSWYTNGSHSHQSVILYVSQILPNMEFDLETLMLIDFGFYGCKQPDICIRISERFASNWKDIESLFGTFYEMKIVWKWSAVHIIVQVTCFLHRLPADYTDQRQMSLNKK